MNTKIILLAVVCALLDAAYSRPSAEEKEMKMVKRDITTSPQIELADVSSPTLPHTRALPESLDEEELAHVSTPAHSIRHKRATCDLLSGFGVNHSACAAHCILIGREGGYCNGQAVCVCRN